MRRLHPALRNHSKLQKDKNKKVTIIVKETWKNKYPTFPNSKRKSTAHSYGKQDGSLGGSFINNHCFKNHLCVISENGNASELILRTGDGRLGGCVGERDIMLAMAMVWVSVNPE